MAGGRSVLELAVQTGNWDAGLKKAQGALNNFVSASGGLQSAMAESSDSLASFIRMMGKMDSNAKTSRQQLKEYQSSFEQLSLVFSKLSEADKSGDVGKALSYSLDQLKGKIQESKSQFESVNKELGNTTKESNAASRVLEQLAGKFGMSVKGAGLLGAALAAGNVAMEAFEKTMQSTEGTADLLASVQMQLNSVVDGFFRSINEGNFDNFLSGLSDIANRAREAYAAMDELSSYAVRYNPKNQSDLREIDKLLKEARALLAKGDKAGAASKTAEAKRIANQAKQNTIAYGEREYQSGVATLRSLLGRTSVNFTNGQIEWYSDPKNWDRIKQKASEYKAIQDQIDKINRSSITATSYDAQTRTKNLERVRQLEASITDEQRRAFTYLNTRDTAGTEEGDMFIRATQQIYGRKNAESAADAIQARIDRADAMANRPAVISPKGGGKSGGVSSDVITQILPVEDLEISSFGVVTSMKELKARLSRYTAMLDTATTAGEYKTATEGIAKTTELMGSQQHALQMGWDIGLTQAFDEQIANLKIQPITVPVEFDTDLGKSSEAMEKSWSSAANAIQAVGSALAGIEDPAAKVMGTIAQAIATMALSYAQASSAAAQNPANAGWGWIAFAATGLATMVSSIAAIKEATAGSYAEGGIIPGNSYTGDRLMAHVNSGELILNTAQQDRVAAALSSNSGFAGRLEAVVTGEQLRLVLNNNSRRRNKGEYLTTKFSY